jgi:subtilisin family serine protease
MLWQKNVVVVAAMGNDGKNQRAYPAAIPGVISVGSVDSDQARSSFSTMEAGFQ